MTEINMPDFFEVRLLTRYMGFPAGHVLLVTRGQGKNLIESGGAELHIKEMSGPPEDKAIHRAETKQKR